jgi:CRISPR-associated endonuclease Cas2
VYVLVCYDVRKDGRRTKLFKKLGGLLTHVQLSVFEGEVPDAQRGVIESLASRIIDHRTDRVRLVTLCRSCRASMRHLGQSVAVADPKAPVVV